MSPLASAARFYGSSIGKKVIVALSGVVLVLFLVGHLTGNLLMYAGQDSMNDYAEFLHGMLHGAGVWIARASLLVALVLHVSSTLQLVRMNRAARGSEYAKKSTVQASISSRYMAVSGLTILSFIVFHILHFTVRAGNDYDSLIQTMPDGSTRHDVYSMVITGFQFWPTVLFYFIAMALLCSHLGHGVSSIFQTLGLSTDKSWPVIRKAGTAFAIIIFLGFVSIPIAVALGALKLPA